MLEALHQGAEETWGLRVHGMALGHSPLQPSSRHIPADLGRKSSVHPGSLPQTLGGDGVLPVAAAASSPGRRHSSCGQGHPGSGSAASQ